MPIAPSTLTLSIIKTFSSDKLFENVTIEYMVAVKTIKTRKFDTLLHVEIWVYLYNNMYIFMDSYFTTK